MTFGRVAFAIAMIATGVLAFVHGDFVGPWVPTWLPMRGWPAYACASVLTALGVWLIFRQQAARPMFAFTLLWLLVFNVPRLFSLKQPALEWLGWGEVAAIVAGALALTNWSLVAARLLLGAAIVPIGLSHFSYLTTAMTMVPAPLPYKNVWVIFTGVAHLAAAVALITGVRARLAAYMETAMVASFALFCWVPPMLAKPDSLLGWVRIVTTVAVAAGICAIATRMPPKRISHDFFSAPI